MLLLIWKILYNAAILQWLEAVEAYNPEKGYKFTSYMTFKYKKQIYEMFGNVREGDKRIFPAAASSLNITLENDGHETELLEMLEDKSAGSIESDYEKKELQQIVRAAVGSCRSGNGM